MADQDGGGVTLGKFKFLRSLFDRVRLIKNADTCKCFKWLLVWKLINAKHK